ncbi:hypothetical protein [Rhodopila sp.]
MAAFQYARRQQDDISYFIHIARAAERELFDIMFLAHDGAPAA